MSSSCSPVRLEVYVQSLEPTTNPQIGELLERIEQLETTGTITSSKVYVVGKGICPNTAFATEAGQHLCGRFLQFRDWAKRTGRQFNSFFYPRSVRSEITGDEHETITVPTFTLAEFSDDTLQFVTPCTDDGIHCTPRDRLEKLFETDRFEETDRQLSRY